MISDRKKKINSIILLQLIPIPKTTVQIIKLKQLSGIVNCATISFFTASGVPSGSGLQFKKILLSNSEQNAL